MEAMATLGQSQEVEDQLSDAYLGTKTKEELVKIAANLGFDVEAGLRKERIVEAVKKIRDNRFFEAKQITDSACREWHERWPDDPIIRCKFTHMDGDTELSFTWDGGRPPQTGKSGRPLKQIKFHLFNHREYDLPWPVVQYLNSKVVPDTRQETNELGETVTVPVQRNRFLVQPLFTDEQVKKMNAM